MKRYLWVIYILAMMVSGCGQATQSTSSPKPLGNTKPSEDLSSTGAGVVDPKAEKMIPPAASANSSLANPIDPNAFQPFLVYADKGTRMNHFVPSGFMPDGQCLTFNDTWKENCHSGSTCIKIVYDVECSKQGQQWAGIYWLQPANNWGNQKGGFNLTGSTKLTFWAKGEKGEERLEEVKMGGLTGQYPDSDTAMIGPIILTSEWKQYTIDLRGKDLSYLSGGFAWATNVDVNPNGCTFYLDDIQYE